MLALWLQPPSDTQPIAHRTRSHGVAMLANPPKSSKPQKVAFILPSDHSNKYSKAYRQLTPARLQLAREQTPWRQSPVAMKWLERSCAKVWAHTLRNNQFAPLADDEDNKNKTLGLHSHYSTMQQVKRWNTVNSGSTQRIKKLGIYHTPMNLVDYAKALAANPTIHLPPVAPPPVPLVLPHNNNVWQ